MGHRQLSFKAPKTPNIWKNPWHVIACGFGVGKVPIVPGTFGTLLGVVIYCPLSFLSLPLYLIAAVAAMLLGVYACGRTAKDWGVDDPVAACWDEVAGFLFAMMAVPNTWGCIAAGFVLFRFFDIVKPGPVGWLDDHLHGGWGIILDDVVAGLLSCIVLQLLLLIPVVHTFLVR